MTNLEKFKQKLTEAQDGYELLEAIDEIYEAHDDSCRKIDAAICAADDCEVCFAAWFENEAEE